MQHELSAQNSAYLITPNLHEQKIKMDVAKAALICNTLIFMVLFERCVFR